MKLLDALLNGLLRLLGLGIISITNSWLSTLSIERMSASQDALVMFLLFASIFCFGYRVEAG